MYYVGENRNSEIGDSQSQIIPLAVLPVRVMGAGSLQCWLNRHRSWVSSAGGVLDLSPTKRSSGEAVLRRA